MLPTSVSRFSLWRLPCWTWLCTIPVYKMNVCMQSLLLSPSYTRLLGLDAHLPYGVASHALFCEYFVYDKHGESHVMAQCTGFPRCGMSSYVKSSFSTSIRMQVWMNNNKIYTIWGERSHMTPGWCVPWVGYNLTGTGEDWFRDHRADSTGTQSIVASDCADEDGYREFFRWYSRCLLWSCVGYDAYLGSLRRTATKSEWLDMMPGDACYIVQLSLNATQCT